MDKRNAAATIDRRKFVARLLAGIPDALVVTGLGSPSYDVFATGDRDSNFYLWGAMGGAASLGLGLALAQSEKSVVVVTGDGEQLMGIGSLATIAAKQPSNLTIVVLDNGHYGETGMQQSHSSLGTDLVVVARGFGITDTLAIRDEDEYPQLVERVLARKGPVFAQVHIKVEEPPRALPPRDGVHLKNRFRAALGYETF
ncbi:aldehyde dehydrogenase [Burkholderia sp. WAC0059]|uniref:thiamine pyrophosphate-dependent enzyme n=1 Tax=Burkholderia sp. WAC0059 TaxID=2066022 RepID=UPI000C7F205D|nr:thiamine pyrophosphate-dependent enzyme [Burkholderia sp. WAC0059]PLZ00012.1 aldehyde dehydrogenase [Burkholderia sp. WAC0059]